MLCGWIVDQDQSPTEEEKTIWGGECQVHKPLFTGLFGESTMSTDLSLQSGQVPSLPISLHRSSFASAKFTDLPLQIPPYRQMAEKNIIIWVRTLLQLVEL
jgi:hypothetical protein